MEPEIVVARIEAAADIIIRAGHLLNNDPVRRAAAQFLINQFERRWEGQVPVTEPAVVELPRR
jgi:hypothetical protein